jgi:hypothetical protein
MASEITMPVIAVVMALASPRLPQAIAATPTPTSPLSIACRNTMTFRI